MVHQAKTVHVNLDTPEAAASAARLNAYKQELIQERWLSTLILSIHLEVEACLEVLVSSTSLASKTESSWKRGASFSTKLSRCDSMKLLKPNVLDAVKTLNKLRNELAHRLDNRPTNDSLFRFIESMSAMHPLSVTDRSGLPAKELKTFEAIKSHFTAEEAVNLEDFVFVSVMLLRATLFARVKAIAA